MKRFLSLLLTVLMLATMIPMPQANAETYEYAEYSVSASTSTATLNYGPGTGTHTYTKAVDICNTGWFYAPFTGTILYIDRDNGNTVWFTSVDKVITADGQPHYVTLMMTHMNDAEFNALGYSKGTVINKGEKLYHEGKKGAKGTHIHLECALCKLTESTKWHYTGHNFTTGGITYHVMAIGMENSPAIGPEECLLLRDDLKIKDNTGHLTWKHTSDLHTHNYVSYVCKECGGWDPSSATKYSASGCYSVKVSDGYVNDGPYDNCTKTAVSKGEYFYVSEYAVNAYGNKWYHISTGTYAGKWIWDGRVASYTPPVDVSFTGMSHSSVTKTNATVAFNISVKNVSSYRVGVEVVGVKSYVYPKDFTAASVPSTYNLTSECGITLQPGTTYKWRPFIVVGGKNYYSPSYDSFTTTADESQKPAIKWNNLYVENITATTAVVKTDVTATTSRIKTIGLQMCKNGETLKSVASWPVGSTLNYCYVKCDGTEAPKLSPSTTYKYRFYIVRTDNAYEYSDTKSFSTPADATSPIKWNSISVTNVTATSAVVKADVTATTSQIKTIGLQMCKNGETMKSVASWPVGSVLNYCYVNCDGSEAPKLSPNTTYQYRFYIVKTNGGYEYSGTKSFTTLNNTSSAIKWDNVYVSNVGETSAVVKTDVTADTSRIKTIGLMMCKDGGTMKSVASWPVYSILNYCYVACDGSEAASLSPNTKYNYCFYIIRTDGGYEYSPTKSFTTSCGHSYNSGSVTTSATCTAAGVKTFTCTKCGATRTESIAALGHNYKTTVVSPTCIAQGYTNHQCTRCSAGYKDNYTDKVAHSFVGGKCSVCGVSSTAGGTNHIAEKYSFSEPYKNSKFYAALVNVDITGDQRTDIVSIARSQIGYQEGLYYEDLDGCLNGGKTQPKKMSYLEGGKYLDYEGYLDACEYNYWRWGGADGKQYISSLENPKPAGANYDVSKYNRAWCATFVSWCARMAGVPYSIISNSTFASPESGCMNVPYFERGSYTPKAGDLIYFGSNNWKHVGIVEKVEGSSVTYIDGNGDDNVSRHTINVNDSTIRAYGVPSYNGVSDIPPITWRNVYAANVTDTTAVVKADVTANTGVLKTIGLQMCKDGGTMATVASWAVGSVLNYCYVNCDGSEAAKLSPATTYKYRFFVVKTDGSYEYSDVKSFTTLGTTSSAIVWDNIYVSDVNEISATVKADVTADTSRIKTVGLMLCESGGTLTSVASWPVNSVLNYCYVKCDGSEAASLNPGTAYDYCFYIIRTDGSYEYSAVKSFTTHCNHEYDEGMTIEKADCFNDGEAIYTCTKCGAAKIETVYALGHDWDGGKVIKQATETSEGEICYTCTRCKETMTETTPVLTHTHVYSTAKATNPTCTEQGYITYTCACGESYKDGFIPAFGHSYADGVCTRCGADDPDYKPPVQENPFVDVKESSVYYNAILWAYNHKPEQITGGFDATHFVPNNPCTRAQVVTFLWRAAGCPAPASSNNPFVDVSAKQANGKDNPYYKAILWAAGSGITNGTDATHFSPNSTVTRAQFVTFLWRYENEPASTGSISIFADANQIAAPYQKAVAWAVESGITNGTDATHFSPKAVCTRWAVVLFMYRDMA